MIRCTLSLSCDSPSLTVGFSPRTARRHVDAYDIHAHSLWCCGASFACGCTVHGCKISICQGLHAIFALLLQSLRLWKKVPGGTLILLYCCSSASGFPGMCGICVVGYGSQSHCLHPASNSSSLTCNSTKPRIPQSRRRLFEGRDKAMVFSSPSSAGWIS
jgi:hypothetical protein